MDISSPENHALLLKVPPSKSPTPLVLKASPIPIKGFLMFSSLPRRPQPKPKVRSTFLIFFEAVKCSPANPPVPAKSFHPIAICGKYNGLHDAYKSILEAFIHSGVYNNTNVNVRWVDTEELEINDNPNVVFRDIHGILIPGGFGDRGIEGKIMSSRYARENNIPFFGICLGMQCAVIDYARHECNMRAANSTEFNKRTKYPVIDLMRSQKNVKHKGASMRLGSYKCNIMSGTNASKAYKKKLVNERHRHRYEFNNKYKRQMEKAGLKISGVNEKLKLVEMIEFPSHPWFVGVQFHPELKSTVVNTHPLFRDFIAASMKYRDQE